jgi:hypothetical protein
VEGPVEVVVVLAAADVEVEGPGTLLDAGGCVVGGLVQLDSTAAATAAKSTLEDQALSDRLSADRLVSHTARWQTAAPTGNVARVMLTSFQSIPPQATQ